MPDYGRAHRALRRVLLARYIPGFTLCWRCEQPITTLRTRDIHLGHDDDNPLIWRGLEHAACNLRAGGITREQMATPMPRKRPGQKHRQRKLPAVIRNSRAW